MTIFKFSFLTKNINEYFEMFNVINNLFYSLLTFFFIKKIKKYLLMNILYLINTDTYTLFYTFFILIICVTWIQYVLKKLQNKYSTFLNNEKIINHCKQILDKNNSLQENIYKLIKYNTGKGKKKK
ncbi:hypothetical protein PFAG_02579 [Plasmodium falciparum Santa Lucia]|uniref:Uncharacterized protein n=1 Tax=Plasmodium falciparum Santa Lucia TaxID=478859 RepID=W7FQK8_PLAFA|nr:hypothetical protein PFAG_02579 [Plasmodium falciparum Santa Lucia]